MVIQFAWLHGNSQPCSFTSPSRIVPWPAGRPGFTFSWMFLVTTGNKQPAHNGDCGLHVCCVGGLHMPQTPTWFTSFCFGEWLALLVTNIPGPADYSMTHTYYDGWQRQHPPHQYLWKNFLVYLKVGSCDCSQDFQRGGRVQRKVEKKRE